MVDIVHNRAAGDLADDAGEIDRTDAEPGGVERDVVVLDKIVWKQADKSDEDLFDTLRNLTVLDRPVLNILEVKQEDCVKQSQYLGLVDVVGILVMCYFTHFPGKMLGSISRQCLLGLTQLNDMKGCYMHKVMKDCCINGCMLVCHQT